MGLSEFGISHLWGSLWHRTSIWFSNSCDLSEFCSYGVCFIPKASSSDAFFAVQAWFLSEVFLSLVLGKFAFRKAYCSIVHVELPFPQIFFWGFYHADAVLPLWEDSILRPFFVYPLWAWDLLLACHSQDKGFYFLIAPRALSLLGFKVVLQIQLAVLLGPFSGYPE